MKPTDIDALVAAEARPFDTLVRRFEIDLSCVS